MVRLFREAVCISKYAERELRSWGIPTRTIAVAWLLLVGAPACAHRSEPPEALLPALTRPTGVLIIGDSLTERSDGFGLGPALTPAAEVVAHGVPGRDFRDWLLDLDRAFAGGPLRIDLLLVPLGTNDGYRYDTAQFVENVVRLHTLLRERSTGNIYYFRMPRTNDAALARQILANNAALANGLPADAGLIDLDAPFEQARATTLLYESTDPIHPTPAGYRLIENEIRLRLFPL